MKKLLVVFVMLSSVSLAQDNKYIPKSNMDLEVINHTHYTLGYNEAHEQASWVAYEFTYDESTSRIADRTNDFRIDQSVSTGSATLADYKGSGYDRGHLAPSADFRFSKSAVSESFMTGNLSPQLPEFNRNGWKHIEAQFRLYAMTKNGVYIVTGPVFDGSDRSIGRNNVTVPSHYYKIAYNEDDDKMVAILVPHKKLGKDLSSYLCSVDAIEKATGLDFFPQLEDGLENNLEKDYDADYWHFEVTNESNSSFVSKTAYDHKQCKGTAKSTGQRCKIPVGEEVEYCRYHKAN